MKTRSSEGSFLLFPPFFFPPPPNTLTGVPHTRCKMKRSEISLPSFLFSFLFPLLPGSFGRFAKGNRRKVTSSRGSAAAVVFFFPFFFFSSPLRLTGFRFLPFMRRVETDERQRRYIPFFFFHFLIFLLRGRFHNRSEGPSTSFFFFPFFPPPSLFWYLSQK